MSWRNEVDMQEKDILNKIIENKGKCDWLLQHLYANVQSLPCSICPLSKIAKRKDGSYLSCYDSLIKSKQDIIDTDAIYLMTASHKLLDLEIEEELGK